MLALALALALDLLMLRQANSSSLMSWVCLSSCLTVVVKATPCTTALEAAWAAVPQVWYGRAQCPCFSELGLVSPLGGAVQVLFTA